MKPNDELCDMKRICQGQVYSKETENHIQNNVFSDTQIRLFKQYHVYKNYIWIHQKSLKWNTPTKTVKNLLKWNTHLSGTKTGFQLLFT